jgi:sigma-B regulation protein RsbU (phosphoserine phosphatase)
VRILVADDDPIQRDLLAVALSDWGYDVTSVKNGSLAWEALHGESDFSILITDWMMPELDGVDLCRRLRAERRARYLPIILLTSRDLKGDTAEGLNSGADAFVSKPFDPTQLLAQIKVAERILDLEERLAGQLEEVRLANERLERDLAAAAAVQLSLLPEVSPKIPGARFAWVYDACDQLGGDMFNIFRLDETRVGMYVLDVSGHGTSAALQSVSLSHTITPYDQQGGVLKRTDGKGGRYEVVPPAEVARNLSRRFRMVEQSGQYFTFLYGILDVSTGRVRYVRAGHPGPIVVSNGEAYCCEKSGGIPIGILPDAEYEEAEIQLSPGDRLIFYSDGVLETRNEHGDEFGSERLLNSLSTEDAGIGEAVAGLKKRLDDFGGNEPHHDDVTIVGLETL